MMANRAPCIYATMGQPMCSTCADRFRGIARGEDTAGECEYYADRALRDVPPVTLADAVDDAWDAFDTLEPITLAECNEQIAEREATVARNEASES